MTAPSELLVLLGPTGIGKTDLSLELAGRLNAEIISADSRKVYRYMDIGTAKPTPDQRSWVLHHLIDIVDPDQDYNVAQFQRDAHDSIAAIQTRGRLPLVVGGSGLYLRSILSKMDLPLAPPDPALRRQLHEEAEALGGAALHERLRSVDPAAANRIAPQDLRRIIRALEVFTLTQKPLSAYHHLDQLHPLRYNSLIVGLTAEREHLYAQIEQRVDRMLTLGLIEEVHSLLERGYTPELNSMRGLGYHQIARYLRGEYDLETAVFLLKRDTRRFAKRQMTWFRRESSVHWLEVSTEKERTRLLDTIEFLWQNRQTGEMTNDPPEADA